MNRIYKDKEIYEEAKRRADETYKKPSAYKSAYIVKTYKELGGRFNENETKEKPLKRWFQERWRDYAGLEYPVYRPTKKINKKKTPLTVQEIDRENLILQALLKQLIKGSENLPPFKKRT